FAALVGGGHGNGALLPFFLERLEHDLRVLGRLDHLGGGAGVDAALEIGGERRARGKAGELDRLEAQLGRPAELEAAGGERRCGEGQDERAAPRHQTTMLTRRPGTTITRLTGAPSA